MQNPLTASDDAEENAVVLTDSKGKKKLFQGTQASVVNV